MNNTRGGHSTGTALRCIACPSWMGACVLRKMHDLNSYTHTHTHNLIAECSMCLIHTVTACNITQNTIKIHMIICVVECNYLIIGCASALLGTAFASTTVSFDLMADVFLKNCFQWEVSKENTQCTTNLCTFS